MRELLIKIPDDVYKKMNKDFIEHLTSLTEMTPIEEFMTLILAALCKNESVLVVEKI